MPVKTDRQSTYECLAALERKLAWQKRMTALSCILSVCILFIGAGPGGFEELRARRFIVTDKDDAARALLTSHEGATALSIFDSSGRPRARFSVLDDGHPEVSLLDEHGQTVVQLAEREGAVRLQMTDARGLGQVTIGQANEEFGIDLTSAADRSAVRLRSARNTPQLVIIGTAGNLLQAFSLSDKTGLSMSDTTGQPAAVMTLIDNTRPVILLQEQQKRTVIAPEK